MRQAQVEVRLLRLLLLMLRVGILQLRSPQVGVQLLLILQVEVLLLRLLQVVRLLLRITLLRVEIRLLLITLLVQL